MLGKQRTRIFCLHIALLLCAVVPCAANADSEPKTSPLKTPLRIAIVRAPGVFEPASISNSHNDNHRQLSGFEAELLEQFATRQYGEFQLLEHRSPASAINAVASDEADIAAANFSLTQHPPRGITWSLPLISTPITVVHNARKTIAPGSALDFLSVGKRLVITNDGRYTELMRSIQWQFPELSWSQNNGNIIDALAQVANGSAVFTLADQHELLLHQLRFPELKAGFHANENRHVVWALSSDNAELRQAINRFIAYQHFSGAIDQHYRRNFAHLERLNSGTVTRFRQLAAKRLPTYTPWLREAGKKYGYDWRLLAAMSYQESHWSPSAKSPTGVRGFMMLTRKTAYELGVADRTDAKESIFGGTKFLRELNQRQGNLVTEPDRTWLALASYNIGLGHLRDARQLTYEAGDNPNLWSQVKRQLPLLTEKPLCETLKYGCARGNEAVNYVTNIRAFYDLLRWHEPYAPRPLQQQAETSPSTHSLSALSAPTSGQ